MEISPPSASLSASENENATHRPSASPRGLGILRGIAFLFIASALTYLGFETRVLWREWQQLRSEWREDAHSRVIGYREVTPHFNFAIAPENWFHAEGDHAVLWAGWDRRASKHQWFQVAHGDIDPSRLSHAIGRDTVRVIDTPCVETKGGAVWSTIPDDKLVAAGTLNGTPLAYPYGVLDKVLIVNDHLPDGSTALVVYTPFDDLANAVSVFRPILDSERLIMGHTGYLCDGQPLLYDRKTESLWVSSGRGLIAVAGPLRGSILSRLTRMSPVTWGSWRDENPGTRLVVGAERQTKTVAER